MKRRIHITIAAIAAGLITTVTALADDNFNAGAACHTNPSAPLWGYSNTRGIVNLSTTTDVQFVCPIDRSAFGPLGTLAVKVFVDDATTTGHFCCTALHSNASSGASWTSSTVCTTDAGTGVSSLDMTVPGFTGTFDYAYVLCNIPPSVNVGGGRSELRGYRGIEQ